jgi:O-acetyl-ADP-ribose deacetylase (regulator of RNase III)
MDKVDELIKILCDERGEEVPHLKEDDKFKYFRALCNVRPPKQTSDRFLSLQDEFLQSKLKVRGVTDVECLKEIKPLTYLWQGDITTLKCDGIVNAANSQMLGCFCPCHGCIDNAIHTFAGVQLRLECAEIMKKQGHEEPTGSSKITKAYNLPCKFVLHTVGPIVYGRLNNTHKELLKSCYLSCLKLAEDNGLNSLAFCCISTGEFCFPNREAAKIAVETVDEYRKQTGSAMKVIFNVFKDEDYEIYHDILSKNSRA